MISIRSRSPVSVFENKRDEVCFDTVAFADAAVGVGAGRIKVPQGNIVKAVGGVVVGKNPLDHKLCSTVGIDTILLDKGTKNGKQTAINF